MGLRPFALVLAAVAALAVPILVPPRTPVPKSSTETELPPNLTTVPAPPVPTSVPSPFGNAPTTRTPTTLTPPPVTATATTTVPTFSGFLAQSVDFVTADDGFVLGYVRCDKEICFALQHTVDAGASWAELPAPPFSVGPPSDRALFNLHFANALDGWALGTTLWATHDGGRSWHQVVLGGPVVAIASGAGEAYAVVENCPRSPVGCNCPRSPVGCNGPGELYRSTVGTSTWAKVQGAPAGLDVQGGQFSLVVEGRAVFFAGAYPHPELLASADGSHFSRLTVPCRPTSSTGPGPFRPGQLTADSPSDLLFTCIGLPGMGGVPTEVFISHDGGRSFRSLPTPQVSLGGELAMAGPTTLLFGTSGPAGTWLERAVSPDSSWSTSFERHDEGAGLSDLAFVDPLHGAFVYCPALSAFDYFGPRGAPGGTVYLTSDGGTSWSAVHIPS